MKITTIVLAAAALAGCATQLTPEQQAIVTQTAARQVTCSGADDCEVKWGRAVQWVLDTNAFRIQVQTDVMIQTAGPLPDHPELAVVVSKIATGGGNFRFEVSGGCDNMFGCIPTLEIAKASFVKAVMDGVRAK